MGNLVARDACPVCGDGRSAVLADLPYDRPPIATYLESFYGGRLDASLVTEERYVLAKCARCTLIFQRFVPRPALIEMLYGSVALAEQDEVRRARGLRTRRAYCYDVE